MERWLRGTVVAVLILLLLAGIWLDRPADTPPSPTVAAETERYLGIWEGKLALFEANDLSPVQVYDIWIAALPAAEQQRLAEGVAVRDEAALSALLTDYGS